MFWNKKSLEAWEYALLIERRHEGKYLNTKYSYEEIGKAFCKCCEYIESNNLEDLAQAQFAHSVAFRCWMNRVNTTLKG